MTGFKQTAKLVQDSQVIAFPTESFWALGADATNSQAIQQLFRVKHREKGKPIALIAGSIKQVEQFFYFSAQERILMKKYWPGSLTILLRPKNNVAAQALFPSTPLNPRLRKGGAGVERPCLIGVRVPAHAQARALALDAGTPITATSANISGQPPTKSLTVLRRTFPGILYLSGTCGRQTKPSTIIQVKQNKMSIIRKGAVNVA